MDAVAKCGLVGAGEAFKEAESSEYEGARFYQHLEQIIDKHTRAPETRHEPAPTRAELMNEVARLKQENMNLMSVISEQQEQINRLKKTVFEQA
jgi:Mg2+ and Co2+ transporter CorA